MPAESYAVIRSAAAPVRVVMAVASMVPEVLPSRVLRTAAVREVSERVMASSPRLLMPAESYAVLRSAAAPVRVVMAVASMATVVLPSRVLSAAASTEVSLMVME